jgi:hypothetical protein
MKKLIIVLAVVLAAPLYAVGPVAVWNFEGNMLDTSGVGVAADGTGGTVVADPLASGTRGVGVLEINNDTMTTPVASEPKFDHVSHSAISFWVHTPTWNDWWDFTLGKGGNGAPRAFIDSNPGTDGVANTADDLQYIFTYASLERGAGAGGGVIDISPGAWGNPWGRTDQMWHHIGIQVRPYNDGTADGFAAEIFVDGVAAGWADTQSGLEFDVVGILQTDAVFEIGNNANWQGYLDDVVVWDGWADASVWAEIAAGNTGVYDQFVPEPATLALLGLGAVLIRKRK